MLASQENNRGGAEIRVIFLSWPCVFVQEMGE